MIPFNHNLEIYKFWKSYRLLSQQMQYHLQPIKSLSQPNNIFMVQNLPVGLIEGFKKYYIRLPYDLDNLIRIIYYSVLLQFQRKQNKLNFRTKLVRNFQKWKDQSGKTQSQLFINKAIAQLQIKKIDAVLEIIQKGQGHYKAQTAINMLLGIDDIFVKWFKRIIGNQFNSYRLYQFMRIFDLQLIKWQPSIMVFKEFQLKVAFENLYIDILFEERKVDEKMNKYYNKIYCLNSLNISPIAGIDVNMNDSLIGALIKQINHQQKPKINEDFKIKQRFRDRLKSETDYTEKQNILINVLKRSQILQKYQCSKSVKKLKSESNKQQNGSSKIKVIRNFFKPKCFAIVSENTNVQMNRQTYETLSKEYAKISQSGSRLR